MKVLANIGILGMVAVSLSGCQMAKSSINFVTDNMYVVQLPETTSTKLQVITSAGGSFNATPNSNRYRSSTKLGAGVLSMYGSSKTNRLFKQGFTEKERQLIFDNDLNMPKPTDSEKRTYQLIGSTTAGLSVTERYITPNQPFSVLFRGSDSFSNCSVDGTFIPEANTNYRLTGLFGSKCVIILEKFVKDSRGNTSLQPVKLD